MHWRTPGGGEIFVPKIPSFRITDLAQAIGPNVPHPVVGIRPGEKLHEEMITETDSLNTLEFEKYYVILPSTPTWNTEEYRVHYNGTLVPMGFKYNSGTNAEWLDVEGLKNQIRTHVDASFV